MKLFDKKFVHFIWSGELEGKKGFFADSINVLKSYVEDNDDNRVGRVSASDREDFPFYNSCGGMYRFFYCDPNYECKHAYNEGKQIQYKFEDEEKWYDISSADKTDIEAKGMSWFDDDCEYRIKQEGTKMIKEELEKENTELKEKLLQERETYWSKGFECAKKKYGKQLTKAKEILKEWIIIYGETVEFYPDALLSCSPSVLNAKTMVFLSEVEND